MRRTQSVVGMLRVAASAMAGTFYSFFVVAAAVNAAVVPVVTPVADPPGTPFLAPEAGLGADWVSYQLNLQGTAGELIRAVDVRIYGALHQRWVDLVPSPNGAAADGKGDSHLTMPAGALPAILPRENNLGVGSPLPDDPGVVDYGVGSELLAAWGIPSALAASNTPIGYLVVPRNAAQSLKIAIQVAGGTGGNSDILAGINSDCAGFVCNAPNLDVIGKHHDIVDGDLAPSLLDGSDFGVVTQGSSQFRTFTLNSAGTGALALGTPIITGPFSLSSVWPSQLPQNNYNDFNIQLNTSVPGIYSGSISFTTNDPLAPTFNFALSATVVPEPTSGALFGVAALGLLVGIRRK
jgi:hypothetical protein